MPEQDQPPKTAPKTARKQPAKPAKKAAPRKAAKKSPAKAAKKAAAGGSSSPRDSILNRIAELEERIAAEPPRKALPEEQLVADAPPRPVAIKRPAPRKPTAPAARRPVTRPARQVATVPAPSPEAPEPVAAELDGSPVFDQELAPTGAVLAPAPPALDPDRPAPRGVEADRPPHPSGTPWGLPIVALVVTLLAVAAGLGAAAVARSQPATWTSSSTVTVTAAPAASASGVPAELDRYRQRVASSSFTAVSLFQAGLARADLRALLTATEQPPDQLVVEAKATSKAGAAKLAAAAGRALVMSVTADSALANPADRLTATSTLATDPRRESPKTRDVLLAGLLAAVATLLIATIVAVLVTGRQNPREPARGSSA